MANNPIILIKADEHEITTSLELHPNRQLVRPTRNSDYEYGVTSFWFEEMIMESRINITVLKRLSICPETNFLMYLQTDLPLKWIMFDPIWGHDEAINAQFQTWVIERTILDAKNEDRS